MVSRDCAVGTATSYWLDDREIGIRLPVGSRIFPSPCRQTSYPMGILGFFPGGKAAGP
jgi:hypothetical protein